MSGKVPVETVTDIFQKYEGVKEYNGVVKDIQVWFYGRLVRASWCATSMSWALGRLGIMKHSIGVKQENVFLLHQALEKRGTAKRIPNNAALKRGDIVIILHEGIMSTTANKHVTSVYKDVPAGSSSFVGLGGNQGDSIKQSTFSRSKIYAVWRPDYESNTVNEF